MTAPMALKESRTRSAWVQEWAQVVAHEGKSDLYKLTLRAPEIARRAVAGQFVEVRCVPGRTIGVDPMLRRPFSICEIRPEQGIITLVYRVVGRGTRALSMISPGLELDLMGPLGQSFPDPGLGTGLLLLVGGGLGIPPMVAAAERALASGRQVQAIIGARSQDYLAASQELTRLDLPVTIMTDDGSLGAKGFVTAPLEGLVELRQATEVWSCGPEAMLQAVKALCVPNQVACFVSVERFMACGYGVCIGCTVPKSDHSGYLKACYDGPVFLAEEVDLGGF